MKNLTKKHPVFREIVEGVCIIMKYFKDYFMSKIPVIF